MDTSYSTEQVKAEIENLRQELHVVKRKLDVSNRTIADLSEELEQQQDRSNRTIKELRTRCEIQREAHETIIAKLKAEIAEKADINQPVIEIPQEPIKVQEEKSSENVPDWQAEEAQYQEQINILNQKLDSTRQQLSQTQWKISELNGEVELLKDQLASNQGNLVSKTHEATELRELLEATQEENGLLSAELAKIRRDPSNANQKGNSLFAEVADQRKVMINQYMQLRTRYLTMKSEHENCSKKIKELLYMYQQSETVYDQCMRLIKAAEYNHVKTLKEQNHDLNKEVEEKRRRICYLENKLASNNADWVNKLITYSREEIQKTETMMRRYQVKQLDAAELHEQAVKEASKWRLEIQQLKLQLCNMEVPSGPPLSSDEGSSAAGTKAADVENHNNQDNGNAEHSGTQSAAVSCTSSDEPSGDAACGTVRYINLPKVLPVPSGKLQEHEKERVDLLDGVRMGALSCYEMSGLSTSHKQLATSKANAPDASVDGNSVTSESKQLPEKEYEHQHQR